MNRRRLKALSKRITNKEIANQLGVSVSTIYRYKKGKVKNPKVDHKNEIDKLWNEFKNVKGTKSGKKKHKNAIRHLDYSYKGKDTFETAESVHFNYEIGTLDWSTIEGTIKDLTLNALNDSLNSVCVKDAEVNSISEISENCTSIDETFVVCDGTEVDEYTCEPIFSEGKLSQFKVTGLTHSAVKQMGRNSDNSDSGSSGDSSSSSSG